MTRDVGVRSCTYREFSTDETRDAPADTPASVIERDGGRVAPDASLETAPRLEAATEVNA